MSDLWKKAGQEDIDTHGVCTEYSELMRRTKTVSDALYLYKRGIDWCLERNSPSVELLRKYKDECEEQGIYVDKEFNGEILTSQEVYIFHNCKGTIFVDINLAKHHIPMLYFANSCEMEIKRADMQVLPINVPLYIFGSNDIIAKDTTGIKFWRYDNR